LSGIEPACSKVIGLVPADFNWGTLEKNGLSAAGPGLRGQNDRKMITANILGKRHITFAYQARDPETCLEVFFLGG
jgi:hypothetical protein